MPSVAPHVFIDPDRGDTFEPGRVVDQHPVPLGEDRVIRGVPGNAESFSDPGDGQVLTHDRGKCPRHRTPRQGGSRFGREAGVLAPHMPTLGAPVPPYRDQQCRWSPPERFVGQPADHAAPRGPFAAAPVTPPVILNDPARQHRPAWFKTLTRREETKLIQAAERSQVRRREGSVVHVEVFQMSCVRTLIIGRPRPSPPDRRARNSYTLICDEPVNWTTADGIDGADRAKIARVPRDFRERGIAGVRAAVLPVPDRIRASGRMIDAVGCRSRERRIPAIELGELLRVRTDRIVDLYRTALIADRHPIVRDGRAWEDYADHARRVVADCTVTLAIGRVTVSESLDSQRRIAERCHRAGMSPEVEMRSASLLFSAVLREVRALVVNDPDGIGRIALAAELSGAVMGMHLEAGARRYDSAAMQRARRRCEEDRRRLARDLHDRVGNTISAAARRLEALEAAAQRDGAGADSMRPAVSALAEAMHEVSDLTTELRAGLSGPWGRAANASRRSDPGAVDATVLSADLRTALENLVESMCLQSTSVAIRVVGSSEWLSDETRYELFLVIREALRNSARHSGAEVISVEVDVAPHQVIAVVADDGVGFDAARVTRANGLSSMAERAELLHGEVTVRSRVGQGTSVMVRIPARMVRSA